MTRARRQTIPAPTVAENRAAWAEYADLIGHSKPQVLYHWTSAENAEKILADSDQAVFLPSADQGDVPEEIFFGPDSDDPAIEEWDRAEVQIAVAPDYSDMRWMPGDESTRVGDVVYRGNLVTDRFRIRRNRLWEKE